MKTETPEKIKEELLARASAQNLFISTKHCVEICRFLRYKTTAFAKKILEEVVALKRPLPFKRFRKDTGHKPGMAAGRFPRKAAREVLKLIKSVEANAQFKGLNTSALKIIKLIANRASVPLTGRRHRTATKRTSLEIVVAELKSSEKKEKSLGVTKRERVTKKEKPLKKEADPAKPAGENPK